MERSPGSARATAAREIACSSPSGFRFSRPAAFRAETPLGSWCPGSKAQGQQPAARQARTAPCMSALPRDGSRGRGSYAGDASPESDSRFAAAQADNTANAGMPTEADVLGLLQSSSSLTLDAMLSMFTASPRVQVKPTRQELRELLLHMVQSGLLTNHGGVFKRGRVQYFDRSPSPWLEQIASMSGEVQPDQVHSIASMEPAVMQILKQHSILPLDRIHNYLKFLDEYTYDEDELKALVTNLVAQGKVSESNGWYSPNVGRQHTPVGSRGGPGARSPADRPSTSLSPTKSPPSQQRPTAPPPQQPQQLERGASPSYASSRDGSSSSSMRPAEAPPRTASPPAGPSVGRSLSPAVHMASPDGSQVGDTPTLTRSQRMSLVSKRTHARKKLQRELDTGNITQAEFDQQLAAMEAEYASKLGTPTGSRSTPKRGSKERSRTAGAGSLERSASPSEPRRSPSSRSRKGPPPVPSVDTTPRLSRPPASQSPPIRSPSPTMRPGAAPAQPAAAASGSLAMDDMLSALRDTLTHVQAVVRSLEAKESLYEDKPEPERKQFYAELNKSRQVLSQVRNTLLSFGDTLADDVEEEAAEEEERPSPPPARPSPSPEVSRPPPSKERTSPSPSSERRKSPWASLSKDWLEKSAPEEAKRQEQWEEEERQREQQRAKLKSGQGAPQDRDPSPSESRGRSPLATRSIDEYVGVQEEELAALQDLLQMELEERGDTPPASRQRDSQQQQDRPPAAAPKPKAEAPRTQPSPPGSRKGAPPAARMASPSPSRDPTGWTPRPASGPPVKQEKPQQEKPQQEKPQQEKPQKEKRAGSWDYLDNLAKQDYMVDQRADGIMDSEDLSRTGGPMQVNLPQLTGLSKPPRSASPRPTPERGTPGVSRTPTPTPSQVRGTSIQKPIRPKDLNFQVQQQSSDEPGKQGTLERPEDGSYLALISWQPDSPVTSSVDDGQDYDSAPTGRKIVWVRFALPYKVAFGEVIKLAGGSPEFGNWSVEDALLMKWTEGDVWVADLMLAPGTFEIKAIVRNTVTKDVRWEAGDNHTLTVPKQPGTLFARWPWATGELELVFVPSSDGQAPTARTRAPTPQPPGGGQRKMSPGRRSGMWAPGGSSGGGGGAGLSFQGPPNALPSKLEGSRAAMTQQGWDDEQEEEQEHTDADLHDYESSDDEQEEDEEDLRSADEREAEQAAVAAARSRPPSPSPWRRVDDPEVADLLKGGSRGSTEPDTQVEIRLDYQGRPGDVVKLLASFPELGAGDPSQGVTMKQAGKHEWVWKGLLPPGTYDIKAVVLNEDRRIRWEPGPRREVEVPVCAGTVRVWCDWGSADLDYDLNGKEITQPGWITAAAEASSRSRHDEEEEQEEEEEERKPPSSHSRPAEASRSSSSTPAPRLPPASRMTPSRSRAAQPDDDDEEDRYSSRGSRPSSAAKPAAAEPQPESRSPSPPASKDEAPKGVSLRKDWGGLVSAFKSLSKSPSSSPEASRQPSSTASDKQASSPTKPSPVSDQEHKQDSERGGQQQQGARASSSPAAGPPRMPPAAGRTRAPTPLGIKPIPRFTPEMMDGEDMRPWMKPLDRPRSPPAPVAAVQPEEEEEEQEEEQQVEASKAETRVEKVRDDDHGKQKQQGEEEEVEKVRSSSSKSSSDGAVQAFAAPSKPGSANQPADQQYESDHDDHHHHDAEQEGLKSKESTGKERKGDDEGSQSEAIAASNGHKPSAAEAAAGASEAAADSHRALIRELKDMASAPDGAGPQTGERQQSISRMLAELKQLSNLLQAGGITRAEFERSSAVLREQWLHEVLDAPGARPPTPTPLRNMRAGTITVPPPAAPAPVSDPEPESSITWAPRPSSSTNDEQLDAPTPAHDDDDDAMHATDSRDQQFAATDKDHAEEVFHEQYDDDELYGNVPLEQDTQLTPAEHYQYLNDDQDSNEPPYDRAYDQEQQGYDDIDQDADYGFVENEWAWHRGGVISEEPPVSPLGYPVPPEILALKPGAIFSKEVLRSSLFHADALDYVPEGGIDAWTPNQPLNPSGWGTPFSPSPSASTANATAVAPWPAAGTAKGPSGSSGSGPDKGETPGQAVVAQQRLRLEASWGGGGGGSRSPSPAPWGSPDNVGTAAEAYQVRHSPSRDGGGEFLGMGMMSSSMFDHMADMLKMDSTVLPAGLTTTPPPPPTPSPSSAPEAAGYAYGSQDRERGSESSSRGQGGEAEEEEERQEARAARGGVDTAQEAGRSQSVSKSSPDKGRQGDREGSPERDNIGQLWQQLMQPTPRSNYDNIETPTEVWSVLADQLPLPSINAPALKGLLPGPAASKKLPKLWNEVDKPEVVSKAPSKVPSKVKGGTPEVIDLEGKPIPTHHRLFTPSQSRGGSESKASGASSAPPKAKPSSSRAAEDEPAVPKPESDRQATVKQPAKPSAPVPSQTAAAASRVKEEQEQAEAEAASRAAAAKRNSTPFGSVFEAAKRFLDWEDRELKKSLPPSPGKWVYVAPEDEQKAAKSPPPTRPKSPTASSSKTAPAPKRALPSDADDEEEERVVRKPAPSVPEQRARTTSKTPTVAPEEEEEKPRKDVSKVESKGTSKVAWPAPPAADDRDDRSRAGDARPSSSSPSVSKGRWGVLDEEELPGLRSSSSGRGGDDPLEEPWFLPKARRSPTPQRSPSPSAARDTSEPPSTTSKAKPSPAPSPSPERDASPAAERDASRSPSPSPPEASTQRSKSRSPSPWLSLTSQLQSDSDDESTKAKSKPVTKEASTPAKPEVKPVVQPKPVSQPVKAAAEVKPVPPVKQKPVEDDDDEEEGSELEAELLSKQEELERQFKELQERQDLVKLLEMELQDQEQADGQGAGSWTAPAQANGNGNGVKPAAVNKSRLGNSSGMGTDSVDVPEVQEGQVLVKLSMRYVAGSQQVVRFVGGRPEFGSWLPEESPVFYWIQGDMWVADVPLWPGYYQFKPMIYNTETGQAEWEPGPMRAVTVPDRPGGGTMLLNCDWCDFEMEAKFYYDRVVEPDGTVRYSTEILRMDATMDIEGL